MSRTYKISTHIRKQSSFLVDMRTIGGITGDDVRRVTTYLDKTMNVMGIDSHQLSSMPIITV